MAEIALDGCRPTPLAGYLKALGVLRLVAEQADPDAAGWWEADRFRLRTSLDRNSLLRFFLQDYRPTPIIAPWNGRAGFLEGDEDGDGQSSRTGAQLIRDYSNSRAYRFAPLREAVSSFLNVPTLKTLDQTRSRAKLLAEKIRKRQATPGEIAEKGALDKDEKRIKKTLISTLRSEVPEQHHAWLDACLLLSDDETFSSPLFIAGGSDGSRDLGMSFGLAVKESFDLYTGAVKEGQSGTRIVGALFGGATVLSGSSTFGYLDPGQSGYNATNAAEGTNPLNPWDYILALEGALVWVGGVSRRLEAKAGRSAASFPFTVETTRAGAGQVSPVDANRAPGELWAPVWHNPVGFPELKSFFREGRLTLRDRTAANGLEAALAVGSLGLARGVDRFIRIGLYQSDAKMPHTAASLGEYQVGSGSTLATLCAALATSIWMRSLRRVARSKEAPSGLTVLLSQLNDALFAAGANTANAAAAQAVLVGVGAVARFVALRPGLRETLPPPPRLGAAWRAAADDGSPEFRVAAALSTLAAGDDTRDAEVETALPFAAHLGPLQGAARGWRWAEKSHIGAAQARAVWGEGSLVDNLVAVVRRRITEAARQDGGAAPFATTRRYAGARTDEVAAFLARETDDPRTARLLLGLAWIEPLGLRRLERAARRPAALPFAYAALAPLFAPPKLLAQARRPVQAVAAASEAEAPAADVRPLFLPPELPALLAAGRVDDAVQLAQHRALVGGLPAPFRDASRPRDGRRRTDAPALGRRLLAALAIPVQAGVLAACLNQAYPSPELDDAA